MSFSSLTALSPDSDCRIISWAVGDAPLDHGGAKLIAAIGNFDGVHLGHQALITEAFNNASKDKSQNSSPAVMTFNPHPRRFFKPDLPNFALVDDTDKIALLSQTGVKIIIRLEFNEAMRCTSAENFITSILPDLGIHAVCAGHDFAFGARREGNMDLIKTLGAGFNITCHPTDAVLDQGEVISSSRIRDMVRDGRMDEAARLLGRPFVLSGVVEHGEKRGRTIGCPTANITLSQQITPAFGVYSVAVAFADDPSHKIMAGVANIGMRPTIGGEGVRLEVHLLDADIDCYDRRLNVFFLDFIRPEKAFDTIEILRQQIERDITTARKFHASS